MGMADIRRWYKVPAKRGMRVKVDGKPGRIVSVRGGYIRVLFDGGKFPLPCHPTWRFEYEPSPASPSPSPPA